MTAYHFEAAALFGMLVSLPLVSWGTTDDVVVSTVAGTVLLTVGLATLTILRFVNLQEET